MGAEADTLPRVPDRSLKWPSFREFQGEGLSRSILLCDLPAKGLVLYLWQRRQLSWRPALGTVAQWPPPSSPQPRPLQEPSYLQ